MGLPSSPNNRKEVYLSNIAGQGTALPSEPHTREEEYLDYIAKNGGGGGGTGDGDMKKAIYDDDLAVATAGGIADYVSRAIADKVDKVTGKGLSTNDYDNTAKGIVDGVNTALDGKVSKSNTAGLLKNDGTVDQTSYATAASVTAIKDGSSIDSFGDVEAALANKVDKVSGKGLSTNDYDASAKSKLDGLANVKSIGTGLDLDASGELIATGAEITIDSAMSSSSTNPVQNKVITSALAGKQDTLTFDNFPTTGSTNPVTSGGIKSATTEIWGVIGPIEAGLTSEHAYEVGDHFECYFGYVTVIAPIAVGDTIENNVNVVGGTIASTMTQDAKDAFPRDEQAVLGAKNLFNNTATTKTDHSVTITVNADKSITTSGASDNTNNYSIFLLGEVSVKAGTSYTLSGCPSGGGNQKYELYAIPFNAGGTQTADDWYHDFGDGVTFTVPNNVVSYKIYLRSYYNISVADKVWYPMLRLASDTDTTYAPYAMTNKELTELNNNSLIVAGEYTVQAANTWENAASFTLDKPSVISAVGKYSNSKCLGIAISPSSTNINSSQFLTEASTGSSKQVVGILAAGTYYVWVKYDAAAKNVVKVFKLKGMDSSITSV